MIENKDVNKILKKLGIQGTLISGVMLVALAITKEPISQTSTDFLIATMITSNLLLVRNKFVTTKQKEKEKPKVKKLG